MICQKRYECSIREKIGWRLNSSSKQTYKLFENKYVFFSWDVRWIRTTTLTSWTFQAASIIIVCAAASAAKVFELSWVEEAGGLGKWVKIEGWSIVGEMKYLWDEWKVYFVILFWQIHILTVGTECCSRESLANRFKFQCVGTGYFIDFCFSLHLHQIAKQLESELL